MRVCHHTAGAFWVIAGGESGPHARPMHPDWVRSLRDQCLTAGVPFFFKQWGEWGPRAESREQSVESQRQDAGGREKMERVGKQAAGRLLDGREWNERPEEESRI